jgi:hypothetical protein
VGGRRCSRNFAGGLFLTTVAAVLLPLLIVIVLFVAFASCDCNIGG